MNNRYIYGSLTRTSDLASTKSSWVVHPLKREQWETGDYVVGKYVSSSCSDTDWVEITTGRHAKLVRGDLLVGALGVRKATLESVGDWHIIKQGDAGMVMQDLTRAGLFGSETDHSVRIPPHPSFIYQGHVIRNGAKVCMKDDVPHQQQDLALPTSYDCPTILILGTSMSVGKTCTARVIIQLLKSMGVSYVVGTKLAGAGCFSDILSMHDAGADAVFDFVDAGLPSTTGIPVEQYKQSLCTLLSMVASQHPSVVVAEAGASPFESYNDTGTLQELASRAKFVVLCASDAYAVLGMIHLLEVKPDIVTGIATATSAGVNLVETLTGIPALNLSKDESVNELKELLRVPLQGDVPLK